MENQWGDDTAKKSLPKRTVIFQVLKVLEEDIRKDVCDFNVYACIRTREHDIFKVNKKIER